METDWSLELVARIGGLGTDVGDFVVDVDGDGDLVDVEGEGAFAADVGADDGALMDPVPPDDFKR